MMMCDGGMMGWMWLWGLLWLVLIAGGIAFVVWVIASGAGGRGRASAREGDRALSILRERFARGEISEEEYQQRRRTLDAE